MAKSIVEHQKDLIALQREVFRELQEDIISGKYSGGDKLSILEKIDRKAEAIIEKVDKKRALINQYYGEVVV